MPLPMYWTEADYRRHLRSYLNGSSGPDAIEAARYAQSVGESDYMYDIAAEVMKRRVGRYRRCTTVPKVVYAQALRIGVQAIQIPQAERILDGWITTPEPMSMRDLLGHLQIPWNSSFHRWLPAVKTEEQAERILDANAYGGLPVHGTVPRYLSKDAIRYSRGGLPPMVFYEQDAEGNSYLQQDSEWEKRHVITYDELLGMAPIHLLWQGFWSRECLIREGEEIKPSQAFIDDTDTWADRLLAAVS